MRLDKVRYIVHMIFDIERMTIRVVHDVADQSCRHSTV